MPQAGEGFSWAGVRTVEKNCRVLPRRNPAFAALEWIESRVDENLDGSVALLFAFIGVIVSFYDMMKTFQVFLRDGRTATVQAETYSLDSDQYVFHGTEHAEVEFFNASDVEGIIIQSPMRSVSFLPPAEGSSQPNLPGADPGA